MEKVTARELTILRKPNGAWSELERAMAAMFFDLIVGVDWDNPEDLALPGNIEQELINEFRLTHEELASFEVLRINGKLL